MADLLDAAHIDAGLALLYADASLTVYPDANGFTPEPVDMADHYVRVYASIERLRTADGNALDGRSSIWTTRWYAHCVGPNERAATAVAMRVNRAWMDQRPTVAGRSVNPIEQEIDNPPQKFESTGRTVFDHLTVYKMITAPG